jgi:hypothetical protein
VGILPFGYKTINNEITKTAMSAMIEEDTQDITTPPQHAREVMRKVRRIVRERAKTDLIFDCSTKSISLDCVEFGDWEIRLAKRKSPSQGDEVNVEQPFPTPREAYASAERVKKQAKSEVREKLRKVLTAPSLKRHKLSGGVRAPQTILEWSCDEHEYTFAKQILMEERYDYTLVGLYGIHIKLKRPNDE